MSGDRSDVVVVGAGPVGVVAACELARHGVAVRIIDKLTAPTTESRAIVVHARSLEMFDQMGIAEAIRRDHRRPRPAHRHPATASATAPASSSAPTATSATWPT